MTNHRTIAIIIARAGSKGLPGKNLKLLAGRPLLAHSIEHARQSGVCDIVLVTTEDETIADVAREYGAVVPFLRPPELAQDNTPAEPVIQHALLTYEKMVGRQLEIVVYLQPTDVFRTPAMIRACVERLAGNPSLDSVFSVYKTHKNFWRRRGDGYERLASDLTYGPRQQREPVYREDTGVACATRAEIVRGGRRIGTVVDIIPTDDFKTSIDIHTPFDFWLAEKVLTEWMVAHPEEEDG